MSPDGTVSLAATEANNEYANLTYRADGSVYSSWTTSDTRTLAYWAKVTMSADGSYSSIGGYNSYQVGVWNRDGKILWRFPQQGLTRDFYFSGASSPATSVEISGNGQYTAVHTWEPGLSNTLYLFRTSTGAQLWHYDFPDVYNFQDSLAISYEGGYVAVIQNGILFLFGQHDNMTIWSARAMATSVEMSSTGDRIFASNSTTISLYTVSSNATQWTEKPSLLITSFGISSDGSTLVIQTAKPTTDVGTDSILEVPSGRQLFSISQVPLFENSISQASLSGDGNRILLNGPIGRAGVFDRSGKLVCGMSPSQMVISQNGDLVVSYYGGAWSTVPTKVTLLSIQTGSIGVAVAVLVSAIVFLVSRTKVFRTTVSPKNYFGNVDASGIGRR